MKYKNLADEIIKKVGGQKNIANLTHCATRLRFTLNDDSIIDIDSLKKTKNILGAINTGGQLQIIIGNEVGNVHKEIVNGLSGETIQSNSANTSSIKKGVISGVLDVIAGVFTPVLPAITGAGMLKALLALLTSFKLVSTDSQTYYILNFVSDAAFFFLPVLLAYTSALKFKCNPYLAATIAGVLLHPSLGALAKAGDPVKFLGLPVTMVTYSSSVIPIILSVWIMSYVENFAEKILNSHIKFFVKPLLVLLIMAPVTLIVIGPLGTVAGGGLSKAVVFLNSKSPWLLLSVISATMPLIVMTGMHYSLLPLVLASFSDFGYESVVLPAMLASNIAQGAAALAVSLKTKDSDLKQLASSTGITALLGITEPAMYGVNLKYKKPFIGVMIGGAVSGFFVGITALKAYGFASPGLAALPVFMGAGNNFIYAVITCLLSFVVTFIATWILGLEDPAE